MTQAIELALALAQGMNADRFLTDERTQWAVYSQIVVLGEAASRLPRDFQETNPQVP